MERECVVFGCRNSTIFQAKKNDCNFFNFPLHQPNLVTKWLKKLLLDGWTPGPENVVCEEHFSLDSFDIVDNKRVLKAEAVPSMIDDWRRIIANSEIIENFGEDTEENLSEDLRCRICAKFLSAKDAVDICSKDDNVMEKMMACIPILVKAADSLPKHICKLCLTDLNISYRMLVRAIESEKIFNNLINQCHDKSETNEKISNIEKDVPSMCVICNVQFDDVNNLNAHFREKHVDEFDFNDENSKKPLQDMECEDKFQESLLTFVDIKANNRNLKNEAIIELEYEPDDPDNEGIERCNKEYSNAEKPTNKQKSICNICSMSFTSRDILDFHTENFHKPEVIEARSTENDCIILDNDADDDQMTDDNADTDADLQYVVCQFCMLVFCTVEELNTHLETHIESLSCDICGCLCEDKEKLKRHRETHMKRNQKNNTCPICFTVFLTHTDMLQHSKDVHRLKEIKDDVAPQKWICKYCGKEIGTKLSLSIHERIHTGVRPYVCECCGRSFKSKANLIQHQPVHTGIKRYKCSVCDKAFARKAFVTTHMRVHTGERPFKCEICGNRYTQIGDMRRHKKKHMNAQANAIAKQSSAESTSRSIEISNIINEDKTISIEQETMFENNGLIKLHFAKDVTDFRRILVELQQ